MIWLDITDPKYVMFFKSLIPALKQLDEVVVTTRESANYSECKRLLELFSIESHSLGGFGGESKLGKFEARIKRESAFIALFKDIGTPKLFITGASVEGTLCAFGLGVPIVQFADTPIADSAFSLDKITALARLTLPLSNLIFRPFVVPEICYTSLGLSSKQVRAYNFIDVVLWLKSVPSHKSAESKERKDFCERLGLNSALPIVLVREEEYKAHYVKTKLDTIYECIALLAKTKCFNILLMPRYERDYLESANSPNVKILSHILAPKDFYPFIDVLLGGGGTMNLEAAYLGIPVISTRSLLLFHDVFLIKHGLMRHTTSAKEAFKMIESALKQTHLYEKRDDIFAPNGAGFDEMLPYIKAFL